MSLFSIFRSKTLDDIKVVKLMPDPDGGADYKAERQGLSPFWDVTQYTTTYSYSGMESAYFRKVEPRRIVSGVSLSGALDKLEEIESAWGDKVRGLKKPWNHYSKVRAMLPSAPEPSKRIGQNARKVTLQHQGFR